MKKLQAADLFKLEDYARQRAEFRRRVMKHKSLRRVALGPNLSLLFEDRLTIQYQVQEMLRIERIFESQSIAEELDAYNPLIPDGSNWKATAMIEYPDEAERRAKLKLLHGIEDLIWVRIGANDPILAIADEDLERSSDTKTSAVHFLRFELPLAAAVAAKSHQALVFGVDHPHYSHCTRLAAAARDTLLSDLD